MENLGISRSPEYQAVLIVDYDDGRLFPLTDGTYPKCLLPVANRKLLAYQLDLLAKSGSQEIYIVAPREYQTRLTQFLSEYGSSDSASVEFIWVDEMIGSADGLRAVSERIRGDFVCMGSDVLCQFPLGELAQLHRLRASDVSMILASAPVEESEKKGGPPKTRIDEEDQEFIGLDEGGRVVMKRPALEVDGGVTIPKPLLNQCSTSLTIRTDLQDMGIYIMSPWVVHFVVANKHLSSIRTELVPFLVDRQFQTVEYLQETIPAIFSARAEKRMLSSVDCWISVGDRENIVGNHRGYTGGGGGAASGTSLIASGTGAGGGGGGSSGESKERPVDAHGPGQGFETRASDRMELVDYVFAEMCGGSTLPCSEPPSTLTLASSLASLNVQGQGQGHGGRDKKGVGASTHAPLSTSSSSNTHTTTLAGSGGSSGKSSMGVDGLYGSPADLLRCFAIVYERKGSMGAHGVQRQYRELDSLHLLQRVTNIQAYLTLNRDLPSHTHLPATPWPAVTGYHKKEQSVIGDGCQMDDKVTVKLCSIGKGCTIGAKSKLNNCVLMDHVVIGEGCTIQNTIISANCVVESNSNLNECNLGSGAKVATGSKIKGEAISVNSN